MVKLYTLHINWWNWYSIKPQSESYLHSYIVPQETYMPYMLTYCDEKEGDSDLKSGSIARVLFNALIIDIFHVIYMYIISLKWNHVPTLINLKYQQQ